MSQTAQTNPLTIDYGHTDDKVFVKFSRTIDHVMLTPDEVDSLINGVQKSKQMLAAHAARKLNG